MSLNQLDQIDFRIKRLPLQAALAILTILQIFGAVGLVGDLFGQQTVNDRLALLVGTAVLGLSAIVSALSVLLSAIAHQRQSAAKSSRWLGNAKLSHFIESNLIGIVVADLDGGIFEANDAYLNILGYTRNDLEAGRIDWANMTPSEYRDSDQRAIEEMKTRGACTPFEKEYYRKDGSLVPVLIGHSIFDQERQISVGFVLDITGRKEAEIALRRSEAKFKRMFEANPIGVVVADLDGAVTEANDAYLNMLGYTREDLRTGRVNWANITPPQYREIDQHAIAQMKATGVCDPFEKEYYRTDGRLVPTLLACAVLENEPDNTIGFMLDLTHRKQIEAALRRSEAKFRRLIEANLIGVSIANFEGTIFEANDLFLEMVGYTREDLQAGQVSWLKMTPPEYLKIDRQATANLRKTGVFTPFEKEYWRKDGSRVPVLIGHAAFDEVQEISIGFVLDLSDRKRAEAASILEERNRIAREIHDSLAQAFTSIMVHLEIASYKLELAPETVRQCIETSYELARSGLEEARRSITALRPDCLENGDLYNALHLIGTQMFAHRPTQLVCNCQGEPYSIRQEVEHNLFRIGQEALMNAAKYAKATEVQIDLRYDSDKCILQIKDNGVGFELSAVSFEEHFGLKGMSERANQIGAKLTIQSVLERGTEVTVTAKRESDDEFL